MELRLAVDVGGTFTDVVLEDGARCWTCKVLTTPARPEDGVLDGIAEIMRRSDRALTEVGLFVHGTTLATNALIERRGARIGLLATEGFRDILEIGSESRYDQYELALERPRPLAPRERRFTVPERIDVHGAIRLALDEEAVRQLIPVIAAAEIDALAIAFIHGYANPIHERRAAEILQAALPDLLISLSSEVCPEIREYERTSTTAVNAYVQPLMDRYLARMAERLTAAGFRGITALMTSGGGLTSIETARRFPVRLVESGPAGGAIFAMDVAARLGETSVLAFDMGGTTAKVTLIEDYEAETGRSFEIDRVARFIKGSGLPIRIPVIELVEIGAGGGSLAGVDGLKRVTVGPESASSVPGPACYGFGGTRPAVTDADLLLGLIEREGFAGGRIALQPNLSRDALALHVGNPLGISPEMAAHAVYETVCEAMASAARVHAVERGMSAASRTVIAFGGAAPLHVCRVAEKIGADRIIIPANAGVGSAVGFLAAPISFEQVRSFHMRLDGFDTAMVEEIFAGLTFDIRAWVETAARGAPLVEKRATFMRYIGQGHEIAVDLSGLSFDDGARVELRKRFEVAYQRLFHRIIPGAAIEILNWSVTISSEVGRPEPAPVVQADVQAAAAQPVRRLARFDAVSEMRQPLPVYERENCPVGAVISGPALIAEAETSTYVTPAFDAWIDRSGSIVLQRKVLRSETAGERR